jgi:hypothetical protein
MQNNAPRSRAGAVRPGLLGLLLVRLIAGCSDASPDDPVAPPTVAKKNAASIGADYVPIVLPFVPHGINGRGTIVGTQAGQGIYYRDGVIKPLPLTMSSPHVPADINDHGAIVGRVAGLGVFWAGPDQPPVTFSPPPGGRQLTARAINNSDVVVGTYVRSLGVARAFRWTPVEGFRDITPEGFQRASALAVNDAGEAAGWGYRIGETTSVALRWNAAGVAAVLRANRGQATVISEAGEAFGMVSFLSADPAHRMVRWPLTGDPEPLEGPEPSQPTDINPSGRLVGHTLPPPGSNGLPWTSVGGSFAWLPADTYQQEPTRISSLRVNAAGAIIGISEGSLTSSGLLWKPSSAVAFEISTPVYAGQAMVLIAQVSGLGDGAVPTGMVRFTARRLPALTPFSLGPPVALVQGKARLGTLPVQAPPGTPLELTAAYGGDDNLHPSRASFEVRVR